MASIKTNKANKSNPPTETEAPESGTIVVEEKPVVNVRQLFLDYDQADADLTALEASIDAVEARRSDAVKAIAQSEGNGPFEWNGKHLSVTTRVKKVLAADGSGEVETTRFFFKGTKKAVKVI